MTLNSWTVESSSSDSRSSSPSLMDFKVELEQLVVIGSDGRGVRGGYVPFVGVQAACCGQDELVTD